MEFTPEQQQAARAQTRREDFRNDQRALSLTYHIAMADPEKRRAIEEEAAKITKKRLREWIHGGDPLKKPKHASTWWAWQQMVHDYDNEKDE